MNIEELRQRMKKERELKTSSSSMSNTSSGDSVLRAAMNGDPEAQYQMGERYSEGLDGCEVNIEQAIDWYRKAANQGHAVSQMELGIYYTQVKEDNDTAAQWLKKSAAQKQTGDVCFWLGKVLDRQNKFEESYTWYLKGASLGDERCICEQGAALYYGCGVEENEELAVKLLSSVDPTEYLLAAAVLGEYYKVNESHKDLGKAIKYLKLCAQEGLANGGWGAQMGSLAHIYWGDNEYQDYALARKWFAAAIAEGDIQSCLYLGVMNEEGQGGPVNLTKAQSLFQQAADGGDSQGMCFLADLLMDTNPDEAIEWYKRSAAAGYEPAQKKLDEMEISGTNSDSDTDLSYSQSLYNEYLGHMNILQMTPDKFIAQLENLQNKINVRNLSAIEKDRLLVLKAALSLIYYDRHYLDDNYNEHESEYLQILDGIDEIPSAMSEVSDEAAYIYYTANMFSAYRFKDVVPLDKLDELWNNLNSIQLQENECEWKPSFWKDLASDTHKLMLQILSQSKKNSYGNNSSQGSSSGLIASKVKAIITDKLSLEPYEVTPRARMVEDLGADSLDVVELIMEMEKEFGLTIPDEDAEMISTVGDVISYIEARV